MELSEKTPSIAGIDIPEYYPRNSSYVLQRVYRRLSSTIELMRTLANRDTIHLHEEAKEILDDAKEQVKKSEEKGKSSITPLIRDEHSTIIVRG